MPETLGEKFPPKYFTPTELKAARLRLGFRSRRALAEVLGVSTRAIDSWEVGWRPIPTWIPNFLDCLEEKHLTADNPAIKGDPMKKFIVIATLLFCFGCATPVPMNVIMTNPQTGQSIYVSHSGSSDMSMEALGSRNDARVHQDKAIKAAHMMGYTEMKVVK